MNEILQHGDIKLRLSTSQLPQFPRHDTLASEFLPTIGDGIPDKISSIEVDKIVYLKKGSYRNKNAKNSCEKRLDVSPRGESALRSLHPRNRSGSPAAIRYACYALLQERATSVQRAYLNDLTATVGLHVTTNAPTLSSVILGKSVHNEYL